MANEPLILIIPHRQSKAEVLSRLKPGLSSAARSFPIMSIEEERWEGDRLTFRVKALGQIASGIINVDEQNVRFEVLLPAFIARFAEKIKAVVTSRGKALIDNKPR
jgi:hypothetical protein